MRSLGGDDYQCDGETEHPEQQNRTNDHWSREQTSASPARRWHRPKETILKNKVLHTLTIAKFHLDILQSISEDHPAVAHGGRSGPTLL